LFHSVRSRLCRSERRRRKITSTTCLRRRILAPTCTGLEHGEAAGAVERSGSKNSAHHFHDGWTEIALSQQQLAAICASIFRAAFCSSFFSSRTLYEICLLPAAIILIVPGVPVQQLDLRRLGCANGEQPLTQIGLSCQSDWPAKRYPDC